VDLVKYLQILLRRKWVILVTTVLALAVAVVGTQLLPTTYTAKTVLRVLTPPSGSLSMLQYDLQYADRILATYMAMAVSEPVYDEIMTKFNLDAEPKIKVEVLSNTELMEISVTDEDPVLARDIANTVADILIQRSQELYASGGRTAAEILAEQVDQLQQELEEAQKEYESLLAEPRPNAEKIAVARSALDIKEQIWASRVQQYEEARASEAFRANIISVFDPARIPEKPSGLPGFVIIGLGGVLGVFGGVALAFLFENFDTRLYTTEQIETVTHLPIMGKIPVARKHRQDVLFNHQSYEEEAFRRLRTNIFPARQNHIQEESKPAPFSKIKGIGPAFMTKFHEAGILTFGQLAEMSPVEIQDVLNLPQWRTVDAESWIEQAKVLARNEHSETDDGKKGLQTLLITSAKPQEGKSTIAANLAFALAKTGQKVLVIDGDLRLPKVHKIFDRPNEVGLSNVLRGEVQLQDAIQDTDTPGIKVITSGPYTPGITDLLDSAVMRGMFQTLTQEYDVIIVDTPALLAVTDAATLAPIVDGVVMVVRRVNAQRHDVEMALEQLANVKGELIGVVVNRAQDVNRRYYRRYTTKTN
jgi:capsular exopolysaccharide synthesis family protein